MSAIFLYSSILFWHRIQHFRRRLSLFILFVFLIWYVDCLPSELFKDSTSTVVLDRNGHLLGAHIAEDEQWRFEECKEVPSKFKLCLVEFEDRTFYRHLGVSLKGIVRALTQNIGSGRRVSGGSTLTMQLVRLMRKNPPRTYSEKLLEMVLATRIELRYSKEEILQLYSSHAPFGNNVVGLDAASWRFFGRPAKDLSWAESATLAVLPNAPGLIYPGKNHDRLLAKRNRLLKRLYDMGILDKWTYTSSIQEPLPDKPLPLPNLAPHLLQRCIQQGKQGKTVTTTLDFELQMQSNHLLETQIRRMRENKIYNGAVMVVSVKTGEVLSYVGNAWESGREHSNFVNCIHARRSTGSILKPILYAQSLSAGLITPKTLLLDVPSKFGGFSPKNFAGNFDGLVPADQALSKSLNIPLVHLLNRYGLQRFHSDLRDLGFGTLDRSAQHYGLSLILGGAEVTLFDLARTYTRMGQWLDHGRVGELSMMASDVKKAESEEFPIDRGSVYAAFEAMTEVNRPDEDNNWKYFSSSQKIAWKTGTSFGFRDAWAIGVTPDYLVAVWVGNADGEGRPGLTGLEAAAPLMFEVFSHLPKSKTWFQRPSTGMEQVALCAQSGHRASPDCPKRSVQFVPSGSLTSPMCPYHKIIHLDASGDFRVDAECASPADMQHRSWFLLPTAIEKFYRLNHPDYESVPPFRSDCQQGDGQGGLAILYPLDKQKIYLPYDFTEQQRKVNFEAAHSQSEAIIFWHLDDLYLGQTSLIHQMELQPPPGKHVLTLSDERGTTRTVHFEMLGNKEEND